MDDLNFEEALASLDYFQDLPPLERDHLFDKLIQSHGLLSEVVDHLSRSGEFPELLGMARCAEQLSDCILTSFQNIVPNDSAHTF